MPGIAWKGVARDSHRPAEAEKRRSPSTSMDSPGPMAFAKTVRYLGIGVDNALEISRSPADRDLIPTAVTGMPSSAELREAIDRYARLAKGLLCGLAERQLPGHA